MSNEVDVVAGKRFSDHVAEFERGQLDHDLSHELNRLVRAVQTTGKAGKLKLTVQVKPCDMKAAQVEIANDIAVTMPKAARQRTLAFTTKDGGLQREDPRQMGLEGFDA